MSQPKMILGMQFGSGYGTQPHAWRMPTVDPANLTNFDALVRYARAAERGKLHFLFLPDTLGLEDDIAHEPPKPTLEPLLTLAAVARGTARIGLVATASSTFNDAYTVARQFKTLDVMSRGRAGWSVVPTSSPTAAANYGREIPPRHEKYERLHEMVQVVQGLWGSWAEDAWIKDTQSGQFADASKIQSVNLQGRYVASRGPLPIPPSEQGQPVIFQAGGGAYGLEVAARYANGVIGSTFTVEDATAQRTALRQAAERVGRDPDEIKFVAGVMPAIGDTHRDALNRRIRLGQDILPARVPHLGHMLGISLTAARLDEPLTTAELAAAQPNRADPRAPRALAVAREGWTVREILAHGVIDYHPTTVGPPSVTADHMQEWFEAGAVDGFWILVDAYEDGIDTFVDEVVPILQERGIFHEDYDGSTLREHLSAPPQYGRDPRLQ